MSTPNLKHARAMRREPTDAEHRMWLLLRDRRFGGLKFRRQVPIGPFIDDFVCHAHHLIIEVDGGQHSDTIRDTARNAWFNRAGFRVARYWNHDVLRDPDGILLDLLAKLGIDMA